MNADTRLSASPGMLRLLRAVLVLAIAIGLLWLVREREPAELVREVLSWTRSLGLWGCAVVLGLYMITAVCFLPGTPMALASGFLFGATGGFFVAWAGGGLGALSAFLVGRFVLRERIQRFVAGRSRLNVLDRAVEQQGFAIVMLARLSPGIPFNLFNYVFSLTRIRVVVFLAASLLGMLPRTVVLVYLGSMALDLAQIFSGEVEHTIDPRLQLAGLAAMLSVLGVIFFITRRAFLNILGRETAEKER